MPRPSFVVPGGTADETQALFAAGRLVVLVHADGATEQGESFDPVTDRWAPLPSEGAPRYGSFTRGPGPLAAPSYSSTDDYAVVTWADGNAGPGTSLAILDVRGDRWRHATRVPEGVLNARAVGTRRALVFLTFTGTLAGRYEVAEDTWSPVSMRGAPSLARGAALVAVAGSIVAVDLEARTAAVYDVEADEWRTLTTDGMPSPRLAPMALATEDGAVLFSGTNERGTTLFLNDGGLLDAIADRWVAIPSTDAPDIVVSGVFAEDLAWTGHTLMVRELPRGATSRAEPRGLAFFDPEHGAWWHASSRSQVRPWPLAHDRVLVPDPNAPVVVVPRERLECPTALPSVPALDQLSETSRFAATGRIGDELVVWGRLDTMPSTQHCPGGAPCMLAAPSPLVASPDGVVLSP